MNELFKKPVVIGIFLLAILIALGWAYFDKRASEKQAEEAAKQATAVTQSIANLSNVDPAEFDETVKSEYSMANAKALEADRGNQFSALVVELPGTLGVSSGNNRYVFTSSTNAAENWTITISQKTGSFIRARIPKDDYLGIIQPIDPKLWKFNYVTALQIAEKNGGQAWREKYNPSSVTLTLANVLPNNWLEWTVEYLAGTDKLTMHIDSNSGKILE